MTMTILEAAHGGQDSHTLASGRVINKPTLNRALCACYDIKDTGEMRRPSQKNAPLFQMSHNGAGNIVANVFVTLYIYISQTINNTTHTTATQFHLNHTLAVCCALCCARAMYTERKSQN